MFFLQLLVQPSNLYSQQNGRNFLANAKEVKDLISVNCIMVVSQSPIIPIYCDCNLFRDIRIQNIFTRTRHQEVTKPSFYGQQRCKIRQIINHLNESFLAVFSNEPEKSIDEYNTKFKERSSLRQYLKMKPAKWGFEWYFRYPSSAGYFYKFDVCLGQKKDVEVNLGKALVMQFFVKLKGAYCTLLFDSSPALIHKLFEDGIYAIGAVWSNRRQMVKLKEDNKMSRGESDFNYSKNICCKWYGNKPVLLLAKTVDGMSRVSKVMRQTRHLFLVLTSNFKTPVSCPNIKLYYKKQLLTDSIVKTSISLPGECFLISQMSHL